MQILNNFLFDTENVSVDNLSNSVNQGIHYPDQEAALLTDFSQYLDNELSLQSPRAIAQSDIETEKSILSPALAGIVLPLLDKPGANTTLPARVLTDNKTGGNIAPESILILSSAETDTSAVLSDADNVSTADNQYEPEIFKHEIFDRQKLAALQKQDMNGFNHNISNEIEIANNNKNIDVDLLLEKSHLFKNVNEINDNHFLDKQITTPYKTGAIDVTSKDNATLYQAQVKDDFTLKADESFSERLGEKIGLLIKNNQREAKITLDPAGLGKIDVQIKVVNNEYVVNVMTQTDTAQQVLDQNVSKLKQLFDNESLTFNLSQQHPDQRDKHAENAFELDSDTVTIENDQLLKDMVGSQIQNIVMQAPLMQDSINIYV